MIVEIECAAPHGRQLFFRPIGKRVRGRVHLTGRSEAERQIAERWPDPVPGQIIGVDTDTGEKYVREPLHDREHAALARRVRGLGKELPPERENYPSESVSSWLFWMRRAVDSGTAKLLTGTIPDKLPEEPRKNYITSPVKSRDGVLAEALTALARAVESLKRKA
ncbi:MAG: hypothetical protein RBS80_12910 [Thermoguttaceae bacterium]|jgi:hypothetical protein|nr:hypothetical protein [Thermoguttaceae bacterium]